MLCLEDLTVVGILNGHTPLAKQLDNGAIVKYKIYSSDFNAISLVKDSKLMLKPIDHLLPS